MTFPLRFQPSVEVDRLYDERHVQRIYEWWDAGGDPIVIEPHLYHRIARKLKRRLAHVLKGSATTSGPGDR